MYKRILFGWRTFFVYQDKSCALRACFERWDEYKVLGGLIYENNETDRVKAIAKKHFRKFLDINTRATKSRIAKWKKYIEDTNNYIIINC